MIYCNLHSIYTVYDVQYMKWYIVTYKVYTVYDVQYMKWYIVRNLHGTFSLIKSCITQYLPKVI